MHKEQMVARIVGAYLGSVTGAREAYGNDAFYHERMEFMTRLLEIFDLAMEQENLLAGHRMRVLERVMMAAPDPAETRRLLERIKDINLTPNHWSNWIKE